MPFDALFIRHAESLADAGAVTDHPATYALTERGRQQAATFAKSAVAVPRVVIHSPFLRAEQTAQPLVTRFPSVEKIALPIQEFLYLEPSRWVGTTRAQRQPAVDAYWHKADPTTCDGQAESFYIFLARVETTLAWLSKSNAGPIFLFTHELFMRAMMWRCLVPSLALAANTMAAFRAWQLTAAFPPLAMMRIVSNQAGEIIVSPPFRFRLTDADSSQTR